MHLEQLKIKNHPILKDINLNLVNPLTRKPFPIVVFIGENGCGKTTLLNELFNYNKSEFIQDKQTRIDIIGNLGFHPLFLRQNSLYTLSQNEIVKKINGNNGPFPIDSNDDLVGGKNPYSLRRSSKINTQTLGKDFVSLFNDEVILNAYLNNELSGIKCGGEALKLIDGSKSNIDLTKLSSGQQEILLKMSVLQNIVVATDFILFDEPETSLHPRWQKYIIRFFKEMVSNQDGEIPQMFIATHSEKILESLLNMNDVLIVRFSKENGDIKTDIVNQDLIVLPKFTFAELDYVIFGIPTYDYHNELYAYYTEITGIDSPLKLDKHIRDGELYGPEYFKPWTFKKMVRKPDGTMKEEEYRYVTIPSYIRNYFHHPKEGTEPTEEELIKSIQFLQKLIKHESM